MLRIVKEMQQFKNENNDAINSTMVYFSNLYKCIALTSYVCDVCNVVRMCVPTQESRLRSKIPLKVLFRLCWECCLKHFNTELILNLPIIFRQESTNAKYYSNLWEHSEYTILKTHIEHNKVNFHKIVFIWAGFGYVTQSVSCHAIHKSIWGAI